MALDCGLSAGGGISGFFHKYPGGLDDGNEGRG